MKKYSDIEMRKKLNEEEMRRVNIAASLSDADVAEMMAGVTFGDSGPIPGQDFGDEFAKEPPPESPPAPRDSFLSIESYRRAIELATHRANEVDTLLTEVRTAQAAAMKAYDKQAEGFHTTRATLLKQIKAMRAAIVVLETDD